MRVAMVSPYDLSIPGGAQAQVDGLAEALHRAGTSVTVVAPVRSVSSLAEHTYDLAPVGRSVRIPVNGSRAPVAPGPVTMARTVRLLRRLAPDVVHVHEPLVPGPSLAAVTAGPRPIVATFHRSGTDRVYRAAGVVIRPLAQRIDALVAVSEAARATATETLGALFGPIELIPNGVDLERYGEAAGVSPRQRRGTPDDPLRVVFVGRNEERKGLRVLLDAVSELRAAASTGMPVWRLTVVGPGTEALRRDDGWSDWEGAVSEERKAQLLAQADVFVAPSLRGESFGVILLEAMAAGAAVIASDLPGYRLAAGGAARFVPGGESAALADALGELLSDPTARGELGRRSLERAAAFSMDAIAARYLQLYDGLLGARS